MGKTILITGGDGYVGRVTTEALVRRGHRVVSIDKSFSKEKQRPPHPATAYIQGNLLNAGLMLRIIQCYQPAAVLHLAALTSIVDSQRFPKHYEKYNFHAGKILLETMHLGGSCAIVFSSSAAVYAGSNARIEERHQRRPLSIYGQTKKEFEDYLNHQAGCGIRSVILRYFNVAGASLDGKIGERNPARKNLIPTIFSVSKKKQKKLVIFGDDFKTIDGTAVRDYVHVEDVASANVLALEYIMCGGKSDSFNVGSGTGTSNLEVVRAFEKEFLVSIPVAFDKRRNGEREMIIANPTKIMKILGWKPQHSTMHRILRSVADNNRNFI